MELNLSFQLEYEDLKKIFEKYDVKLNNVKNKEDFKDFYDKLLVLIKDGNVYYSEYLDNNYFLIYINSKNNVCQNKLFNASKEILGDFFDNLVLDIYFENFKIFFYQCLSYYYVERITNGEDI